MKNSIFNGLSSLVLMGFALSSIGLEVAKAQVGSLKITDSSGREVTLYKESHALVIWAGDYQHWDKLNNIEDEAKEVVSALERQGFEVTVVANPTGQKLKQAMQTFIDNYGYKSDNRLLIFFSGHGYTRKKTKGYLVPVDAPDPASNSQNQQDFLKVALDMEQVESWARQIEAKHVLFVFDSCFSGTIFKQRSGSEKLPYIQSVMNKPVRQFLTAGDADQRVPAKSVFTPLFIRALEGEADYTKDGYVTGSELGLYLKQNLSQYTKNQTPQFGTIRDPDLDQGDIVFRDLSASPLVATNSSRLTVNPSPVETNLNRSQPSPTPVTTPQSQPSPSPQLTATAFYDSGNSKYNLKDYQGAIADYNQSIALKPAFADAYYGRGSSKHLLEDYEGAIADYNQSIALKPAFADAYYGRGNSKNNLGDYQGAISDYDQAITLKPAFADAYYGRGNSKNNLGDYQGAISDYDQAITLKPAFADAYLSRGIAKNNLGDYQGAIADYNQFIALKPAFADAYYGRGNSKNNVGDYQGAISDHDQAITLKPAFADAYLSRGIAKKNLGDYQGAIADYNQAIKLNPDRANAYYNRGSFYKELNDNQNAINDFRQAAKLYQKQNNQEWYQYSLDNLKELGVSN